MEGVQAGIATTGTGNLLNATETAVGLLMGVFPPCHLDS